MKNIASFIVLIFLLIPWFQVNALETQIWDEIDITEVVNDDLYIAGGRIDISAPIDWDLIITWGDVSINWYISEDLTIAWGEVNINWNIWDDVRVAWWIVRISSNIDWDLIIAAWEIIIEKDVVIRWDLAVAGWIIRLDWEVFWNAKIVAEQFIFNWTINKDAEIYIDRFKNPSKKGLIKWNLKYKSPEKIVELTNSTKWEIIYEKQFFDKEIKENILWFISTYLIIKLISVFIFASLIFLYMEKFFSSVSETLRKKTGKSFLYWFLTIIWLPFIIILLFISIIWIPFAFFLLFAYIFIFVFLTLLNVIIISSLIINKYNIKKLYQKLLIIFWLAFILVFINWINILLWFFTIWAMAIKKYKILKILRK